MAPLRKLFEGLSGLFNKQRVERDMDDELNSYLESSVEHKMAAGMSREDALRETRLAMGSLETVKDAVRDTGWELAVETIWQDLCYGARLLRRSPGFTVVAVLALALGIGANTAIFSVVNSVLLARLPFERPDRIAMVWERSPHSGRPNVANPINFLEWRARNRSFERIAALIAFPSSLTGDGEPEQVEGIAVTDGFFEILGVQPALGRWFRSEEDKPGADLVAIMGDGLWRRRYAADPDIIGRTIRIDNHVVTVVGVMPATFKFPFGKAELWQPLGLDRARSRQSGRFLSTIARLKDGATLASAQAEMDILAHQLQQERPGFNSKWGAAVVSLRQQVVGDVRTPLLLLLGAVGLVLLIACANVANLILMRAVNRQREIHIRAALGATRLRLVRQFLAESVLLAGAGGAAGLLVGFWSMRGLTSALPDTIAYSNLRTIHIDAMVLLFTAAVAVATGVIFGILPALRHGGADLQEGLKQGSRGVLGARSGARVALVVSELALATVLSIGAGLLIRSFERLASVNPGFDAAHVLSLQVNTSGYLRDSDPKFLQFSTQMLERVSSLPGVVAAGTSHFLPLGRIIPGTGFWRADRPRPAHGEEPVTEVLVVMPGYFAAMNIPLLRGRFFSDRDRKGAPLTVVINQALARTAYAGENPIGKSLALEWGPGNPTHEIVGVVGDVHQQAISEDPKPGLYVSNLQLPSGPVSLVVRTRAEPRQLAQAIEREIHSLNRDIPISGVRTMEEYVSGSVAAPRFITILLGVFAGLALLMAAIGIFGVISYSVVQRTRELGVRRALGADTATVMRLIFSQGMMLAACGIGIGVLASLALSRLLRNLLFDIAPTDTITFCGMVLILGVVSLIACYLPARRAAQVDPMEALRME